MIDPTIRVGDTVTINLGINETNLYLITTNLDGTVNKIDMITISNPISGVIKKISKSKHVKNKNKLMFEVFVPSLCSDNCRVLVTNDSIISKQI